ncbi:bifunctional NAD(P)/FAD-dependent oxidoreductase/class I SAM-dependent methyltransferase [Nonomuraea sp. NPDC049607]|uniref:bifunctional NAD(P)/FAD-dependent oxidoreductase/class I SAM-dependent methyltransferase n=1 Tax=Nonomuraea sp. NPDC049607 TaxID=3154732 RepID=UPI003442CC77
MDEKYDVVVVGGGAAGLSGALTLGRARRRVLVIDEGRPRNAPADGVHTYLGREGVPPLDLLAAGRDEVTGYGGEIVTGAAVSAERLDAGGFRVRLADGSSVVADRLLVTTGLVDELPDLPGVAERWGREVLHCPYCHGWEVRDQPIGVLAAGSIAAHQALLWRQWSADVTLFTHTAPPPGEEDLARLAARGVTVVEGPIAGLSPDSGPLTGVTLENGDVVPCRAFVVAPRFVARSGLLAGLGVETAEQLMNGHVMGAHVPADPTGATGVPGVWVAGNVANLGENVIGAAAAGVRAAAAINADLIEEETRRALAAHTGAPVSGERFWDDRYGQSERIWSGDPNARLVEEIADMTPGTALELGCGEGADAVWLARRGWRVTAADVSGVALARAAAHAADEGVAELIDWQRHDLAESFPEGEYDLVTASYLHSPAELSREKVLRAAAAAVAPGGQLLVIGHAGPPPWDPDAHPGVHLPTPEQVLDALELAEGEWEVLRAEEFARVQAAPGGGQAVRTDNVLRIRRR